jgi:hypothetical protein
MDTAQAVSLLPMMDSQVLAAKGLPLIPGWVDSTHDVYKVQLQKGQIFTASDSAIVVESGYPYGTTAYGTMENKLSLLDGNGQVLTSSDGIAGNSGLAYRVQQDGTYYVAIDLQAMYLPVYPSYVPAFVNYEVDLRPIGLNPSMQDPTWLQKSGGEMDVWLDGTTLDISGPAGHGFGIRGNWAQTVGQSGSLFYSTYTATGIITLQTAGGAINVGLPQGDALTVTTQPGQRGAYFGAVGSLEGLGTFSLSDLTATLGKNGPLGLQLTGTSSTLPNQRWGIDLGSGISNSGVPLNPAVPYLHSSAVTTRRPPSAASRCRRPTSARASTSWPTRPTPLSSSASRACRSSRTSASAGPRTP